MIKTLQATLLFVACATAAIAQQFELGATGTYASKTPAFTEPFGANFRGYPSAGFIQFGLGLEHKPLEKGNWNTPLYPEALLNVKVGEGDNYYYGGVGASMNSVYKSAGLQLGTVWFFSKHFGISGEYGYRFARLNWSRRNFESGKFGFHYGSLGFRFKFK